MIIGNFTKTEDGNFTGLVAAIGCIIPDITLEAIEATGSNPNFRITGWDVELGAAWNKVSERTGKPYISVTLKSPFLPASVYAALVESKTAGSYTLIWNETKRKTAA